MTPERELRERLCKRITDCLTRAMETSKVRDLLIDCRHALAAVPAPTPGPPTALVGTRPPTEAEKAYGLTLEPLAQEVLARPAEPAVPERKPQGDGKMEDVNVKYSEVLNRHRNQYTINNIVGPREPNAIDDLKWALDQIASMNAEIHLLTSELRNALAAAPRAAGGQRLSAADVAQVFVEMSEMIIWKDPDADGHFQRATAKLNVKLAAAEPQMEEGGKT